MKPSRTAAVTGLPRRLAVGVLVAAAAVDPAGTVAAGEPARDWARVQLAWRDDPRPPADLPAGVVPQRRPTRRGLRRAIRRGWPLEQASEADPGAAGPAIAPRPTPPPPQAIQVETTLASPFGPGASSGDALVHRDEPYGSAGHPRQRFDMYLPAACSGGGMPLVIWIHGDDWATGSKSDCPIRWLVDDGYAVASIGYRTSDAAVFPAPLDDCRAAVATIMRNAALWGIDPERVCLAGSGAGGHLAALVAFTADGGGPADRETVPPVAAVCAVAAPSHLTSLGPAHDRASSAASRLVGGPLPDLREAALQASPLVHASADDPPTLIVHGSADDRVPVDQAVRLDVALAAAGVDSTAVILDAGHALPLDEASPAGRELLHFLDRVLGPGPTSYDAADRPATRPAAQGPTDRP
jgi:acetyl esterase/lipase